MAKKPKCYMSDQQRFQVYEYLKAHRADFIARRETYTDAGVEIANALGIRHISGTTLSRLAHAAGLAWGGNQGANSGGKHSVERDLHIVAQEIVMLASELEYELSAAFKLLVNRLQEQEGHVDES